MMTADGRTVLEYHTMNVAAFICMYLVVKKKESISFSKRPNPQ